ncbi:p1/s1 nuclease, putative [Trypanosoma cruzi marinkellei]|uniref:p1/s1 nuclease, putative n=1 Tax=Trypanosoma cruzi marinkellei TaxID=85056 RepID=K2MRD7_TRYCR|nr:p1/s1 nuclease, putative [Trypanosoma cruzi marinkellei]
MATKFPNSTLLFTVLICFWFFSVSAHAWGCTGHMLVNEIARRRLHPDVAEIVEDAAVNLSVTGPFPRTPDFVESGCWADDIKRLGLFAMEDWHYIDTPYNPQNITIKKNPVSTENLRTVIGSLERTLRREELHPYVLSFAIVNIAHFLGDIHQPLHAIEKFSPEYPYGDKGGNAEIVDVHGKKMALHSLWDSICQADDEKLIRPLDKRHYAKLREFADRLEDTYKFPPEVVSETNTSVMAKESYDIAVEVAYPGIVDGVKLTDEYLEKCKAVTESRVVLAGYRLANILNQLLGRSQKRKALEAKTAPLCGFFSLINSIFFDRQLEVFFGCLGVGL